MNTDLFKSVSENAVFVLVFLGIIFAVFLIAYIFERMAKKRSGSTERILNTKTVVVIGMFSAISTVLYIFDFPVSFAPPFYKMDFSDLPAMICGFAYGPIAGIMVEFVKVLLKILIKGTSTAFVGDMANFIVASAFILPSAIIYSYKKTKKIAIVSCIVGTISITLFGSVFNAVYLIPAFCKLYGMEPEAIVGMGTAVNKYITDMDSLVMFAVAPLNLLKGLVNSIITILVYKRLHRVMK